MSATSAPASHTIFDSIPIFILGRKEKMLCSGDSISLPKMYPAILRRICILLCISFLCIQVTQAKPHGYKGSRKGRRRVQEKRDSVDENISTTTVRTRFTTTVCTTQTSTPTAISASGGQCRKAKVAILGAGVAGITAAV